MSEGQDARARILEAQEADLVGPFYPSDHEGTAEEVLPLPPSRWYLTGFLAPEGDQDPLDPTAEDEGGAGPDEDDEDADHQEPEPKQRKHFPA